MEDYITNSENKIKKKKKKDKTRRESFIPETVMEEISPKKKKKIVIVEEENALDSTSTSLFSQDGKNSTKKKKRSFMRVEPEEHLDPELLEEEVNFIAANDENRELVSENDFFDGWPKEDLQELFSKMGKVIPKNDSLKFRSRVSKLNWEQVKFNNYSANECFEKWKFIEKKLRGYRILRELLDDANSWLDKPWTSFYKSVKKNRHPDMPKRPLTSYMLFYMDKKKKFSKKYPNLEMSKLSKIMAEKFNSLPEHKKEKYNNIAITMREEYNEKMQKFIEDHPSEMVSKKKLKASGERSGPKKPLTPFKMFLEDKIKQIDGIKTQADLSTIQHQCKEKWKSMSSKKKVPWIRWAQEAELKYLEELKLYSAENKDFNFPPHKSVLSKKEKAILERMEGKPEKPPKSAYSLFSRIMLKDAKLKEKFETPKERLQEIARLWKEVPKVEKDEYAEKVKHLMEDYKMEYATYLETLSEDKREEELANTLPKKRTKTEVAPTSSKKLKQMTIQSVMKNILNENAESNKKERSLEELIKLEPVHPPEDPFILFKDEYLTSGLSEKKAIKAWKSLSDVQKKKYDQKLDQLKQEYILSFKSFLTSMKPEELNAYHVYRGSLKKESADEEEKEDENGEEEEEDSEEDSESSEAKEGDSDSS